MTKDVSQPKENLIVSRSVAARWTAALAASGWTPIVDSFLDNYSRLRPPISNQEAMFIVHLVRFKWSDDSPYPGFTTIARKMGMTATMARSHARRLEQKGYVIRTQQVGTTSRFDLTPLFKQLEGIEVQKGAARKAKARYNTFI
jgi:DNA-binding MarR family transcriptional regulator